MPNGFFKCQEGIDAYRKVGKEYDNTLDDTRYDHILKVTVNSPHSGRNKQVVRVMVRELADDGNEYIKYDMHELLYDAIGAWHEVYKPNLGTYPIPFTQPQIEFGSDMTTKDVVNGPVIRIDTGYLIPFTKEAADKIHQQANDVSQRERTQYLIKRGGARRITVPSYQVWRDKTFQELETGKSVEVEVPSKKKG
jgi:hypothetical protein